MWQSALVTAPFKWTMGERSLLTALFTDKTLKSFFRSSLLRGISLALREGAAEAVEPEAQAAVVATVGLERALWVSRGLKA